MSFSLHRQTRYQRHKESEMALTATQPTKCVSCGRKFRPDDEVVLYEDGETCVECDRQAMSEALAGFAEEYCFSCDCGVSEGRIQQMRKLGKAKRAAIAKASA